jgi:hypothetical protein
MKDDRAIVHSPSLSKKRAPTDVLLVGKVKNIFSEAEMCTVFVVVGTNNVVKTKKLDMK